ncbi:hypothetical protein OESDEN_02906 [Oesophagostomum dentatum]|uniref:SGNH domain-containing protein n=1 Tax=Oesophagostomum dentatum TaxID=61180 RepID=A0A0B1TIU1_OESDE|nr:hypothetical protein OESDEN_02906 [Oesophagostomum dentatum]
MVRVGDLVYNAFKDYSRHFSVFCLTGCEVMTKSASDICKRENFDYSAMLKELKPDIIFVLSRVLTAKQKLDTEKPIAEDKIFKDYMKRMKEMESIAKKVYLLQALPACVKGCAKNVLKYAETNRNLNDIEEQLIDRDEYYARLRIAEIGRRCKKCEIIDYMPALVDDVGRYRGFDPVTNLVFVDGNNHFTRFGKKRIQSVYNRLAKEFGNSEL